MILIETQIICFVTLFKVPLRWTSKESVLSNMSGGSWFFFKRGEGGVRIYSAKYALIGDFGFRGVIQHLHEKTGKNI